MAPDNESEIVASSEEDTLNPETDSTDVEVMLCIAEVPMPSPTDNTLADEF
jgi:hypothetical protein